MPWRFERQHFNTLNPELLIFRPQPSRKNQFRKRCDYLDQASNSVEGICDCRMMDFSVPILISS
jgi:hypothetical protein